MSIVVIDQVNDVIVFRLSCRYNWRYGSRYSFTGKFEACQKLVVELQQLKGERAHKTEK